jgi:hypothetical protein
LLRQSIFRAVRHHLPDPTFAPRYTQAHRINIMVTERLSWYKRLIELPAGCADAPKLQGSKGMPTAGNLEKTRLIARASQHANCTCVEEKSRTRQLTWHSMSTD